MKKILLSIFLLTSLNFHGQVSVIPLVTNISCNGSNFGQIYVMASGGTEPYIYTINLGASYQTSNIFNNLSAGTYTIQVKDANNNFSLPTPATIETPPLLQSTAVITKPIDCISNATIALNATGGVSPYTYSKDGITFVQSNVFDNLVTGIYTTYAKDLNGCTSENSIVIDPLAPLTATITKADIHCYGNNDGSITVNTTGGKSPYTYTLENNIGIPITVNQTTNVFNSLSSGSYGVKVADANGCLLLQTGINILQPLPILVNLSITPITCNNSKGTVTVTATGGQGTYQYSIDNGITFTSNNVIYNLAPGIYTIIVRDAQNCTSSVTANVTFVSYPTTVTTATSNVSCNGANDGSITVATTGGKTPYSYSIDGAIYGTSNIFYKLYAGTHTITTKDDNGCISVITATDITEPTHLSATVSVENQNITINATGGTGAYKYSIYPGSQTIFPINNTFQNLYPNTYTITVQDENSCNFYCTVIVNPSAPLINGSNTVNQTFTQGQTLANLVVPGENIKWYSAPNATTTSKSKKAAEAPLPLSTVLVDNTTYYASQTINGIESTERLAVTVKLGTLGTNDFVIKDFTYYPNPVKNVLTISNTSLIDEATVISIKGETLLNKKINSLHSEINLSNFSKGIYFLKVKAEGTEKTVKLIKE